MIGVGMMRAPRHIGFISDCSVVVDSVAGRCLFSADTAYLNLYRDCVRWYLYMLTFRWCFKSSTDLLRHVPRELNKDADTLVNLILDGACEQCFWIMPGLGALPPSVPIAVSSDGGYRSENCSSAVAAIIKACPADSSPFVIAYWARKCRETNSLYAEFEGVIDACRLLIQVAYDAGWVSASGPWSRPEFS
jgi:hypothetical protein